MKTLNRRYLLTLQESPLASYHFCWSRAAKRLAAWLNMPAMIWGLNLTRLIEVARNIKGQWHFVSAYCVLTNISFHNPYNTVCSAKMLLKIGICSHMIDTFEHHKDFAFVYVWLHLIDTENCTLLHQATLSLLFSHEVVSNSFATPWTVTHQAPLPTGFPRQESWSGLPFPSPGDLPDSGMEPACPELAGRFFTAEPLGKYLAT